MNCDEVVRRVDGEPEAAAVADLRRHLDGCAGCRSHADRHVELDGWLQTLEGAPEPDRLDGRVRQALVLARREVQALEESEEAGLLGPSGRVGDTLRTLWWACRPGVARCFSCAEDLGSRPASCDRCRGAEIARARCLVPPATGPWLVATALGLCLFAMVRIGPGDPAPAPDSRAHSLPGLGPLLLPRVPQPRDPGAHGAFKRAALAYHDPGGQEGARIAFGWLEKAARLGHLEARYQLGLCLDEGIGVAVDPGRALDRFVIAAKEGHPWSALRAGLGFAMGRGSPVDPASARRFLEEAVRGGVLEAGPPLAALLERGPRGDRDDALLEALRRLPSKTPPVDPPDSGEALSRWALDLAPEDP